MKDVEVYNQLATDICTRLRKLGLLREGDSAYDSAVRSVNGELAVRGFHKELSALQRRANAARTRELRSD